METVIKPFVISGEAMDELADLVATGQSIALVGPRHSGKNWVVSRLKSRLEHFGLTPVVLRFAEDAPEPETMALQRIGQQLPELGCPTGSFELLFEQLKVRSRNDGRPVTLLAMHIDGLERETARQFLRRIRTGVNGRWLTAVIAGESTMYSMVSGPDSVFNCAFEFILQGMDESLFGAEFRRWCDQLGIGVVGPSEIVAQLYRMLGGNFSLARRFLQLTVDRVLNETELTKVLIGPREIREGLGHLTSHGPFGAPFFQQAAEMVAATPDAWPALLELLRNGRVPLRERRPDVLELAGVAHRRDGAIEFSSPLMKTYIERTFGARKRGDLEALAGNFETAFRLYQEGGQLPRPTGLQDELVVAAVVRRLSSAFRGEDLNRLRLLLQSALEWVLGFRSSSSADFVDYQWVPRGAETPDVFRSSLITLRPAAGQIQRLMAHGSTYGFAVPLITTSGDYIATEALMVWEPPEGRPLTPSRAALAEELLNEFSEAYRSILQKALDQQLERLRARVSEITAKVIAGLLVEFVDPRHLLQKAAGDLLAGGEFFSRAFLVERHLETRAVRVWHCVEVGQNGRVQTCEHPAERAIDLEVLSRHLLFDESVSVVPSQLILSNAASDSVLVIIPVGQLDKQETILVAEYARKCPPLQSIEEPLDELARNLRVALDHTKRLALLSEALNRIADPILLFDMEGRVVYANEPTRKLLSLSQDKEPWLDPPQRLDPRTYRDLLSYVDRALKQGRRIVSFVDQLDGKPYQGIVVSDTIKYKKGQAAGILVHIPDQQYYAELVRALQALEEATNQHDAIKKLAQIFQKQGHEWFRYYRRSGDELEPDKCVDGRATVVREFSQVRLPRRGGDKYTWLTIEEGKPKVFHFSEPPCKTGDIFFTPRGLEVIRSVNPPEATRLGKKPGDYWIDFPLMAGSGCIGKFTLPCDENLSPERLEMLRVLAAIAGDVLLRRLAADKSVQRETSSSRAEVLSDLATLSVLLELIGGLERRFPSEQEGFRALKRQIDDLLAEARDGLRRSEASWRN